MILSFFCIDFLVFPEPPVGIQSDTFQHDQLLVFKMEDNVTVDDLLPETMKHFVQEFLECGTCFKRLQMMIMKKDYKLMFEGFIFKVRSI